MCSMVKQKFRKKSQDKTLDEKIIEAEQCGLSYGKYCAMTKFLGKSFEELKREYDRRQNE